MLNDYKGEQPTNVITKEQHEKRPFYKKVSFWLLSALGLFFGGCSVYGLVLGYQYVHAVTEAAHIIADAQSDSVAESALLQKGKNNLVGPNGEVVNGDFSYTLTSAYGVYYNLLTGESITSSLVTSTPWVIYNGTPPNANWRYLRYYGYRLAWADYCLNLKVDGQDPVFGYDGGHQYLNAPAGAVITGKVVAQPNAYGYQQGYEEGFDDGSDAINLPQSVKVLLPVGNEYSVQYKSYVEGVVDRQGQLNSSQTGGAYATFDRSRTQKLRLDLTLPSGSRAFFLYTPSWTSAYPTDENYPLRQSWAVSGVTYLPTWVSKPQIYVGVTTADVPDLTYETISVVFDVDHWGDIKVGAYSQGYNDGYQAGEENPTAYDSGYDAGYSQGYDDGHTIGIAQGESQAVSGQKALVNMFVTAFQQPFDQIYRFLNFNVLGLNILALFTALLTLSIGIIIIKKVI